jgi:signal transduction histidine kinase
MFHLRSVETNITRRFTRLYILALSAVAFLSILGQVLVQVTLHNQLNDSWIINYAGRQRFQSQEIVKNIVLLNERHQRADAAIYLADLKRVLPSWEKYHEELKNGDLVDLGVSVSSSDTIRQMFLELEPHFQVMLQQAKRAMALIQAPAGRDTVAIQASIQAILDHEMMFLKQMDAIVFQYDHEAKEKVKMLQSIELFLLGFTVFILMLEGLLIFRPAVRQLRQTIYQLIEAENQTMQMNEELVVLNESLQEAKEELLTAANQKYQQQINEQKLRAAYLIEGQEEERKRMARELHDGLGQMLTALKFGIENIGSHGQFTEKGEKALNHLKELIIQTIQETRTISFNLMPAVLSDFGITSALKLLVSQTANSTGVNITFLSSLQGERLPKNVEIGLYRIAQEGLHNALKYAQATNISLTLSSKKKHIQLTIADNGKGFEYESAQFGPDEKGVVHGISNMKERSNILNGDMKITSRSGKGTRILIKVPLILLEDEQDYRVIS